MSEKLACYAVTEEKSRQRQHRVSEHPYRSAFERDRDRIMHSSAFRRLEGKTQDFSPGVNDHYRTRLTHSIEVAQIGRTIAKNLRCNEQIRISPIRLIDQNNEQVGIVEVRPRSKAPGPDPNLPSGQRPQHRGGHGRGFIAGRLRLQVIPNRTQETLEPVVMANVQPRTEVRTDGWTGYDNLHKLGYRHNAVSVRGDHAETGQHLPMIHIVFGNLDAWLLGTHHGVSPKHLQGYLNEFVFRFNRRFWPMVAFDSVLKIAVRVEAPTHRDLYDGERTHPNPVKSRSPVLTG